MNREEMQKVYLDFLSEEGFKASVDEDGDIRFKFEGNSYFLIIDDKSPDYFKMKTGYLFEIDTNEDKIKYLQIANTVNAMFKLGKIFLFFDKGILFAEISFFLVRQDDFKSFFHTYLRMLRAMIGYFLDKVKEVEETVSQVLSG